MARAVWKGPFVEESLMKKVDKYKLDPKKIPIKTWSRKSTILPDFVGVSFLIYNGKKFVSGFFTSLILSVTSSFVNLDRLFLILSISLPFFPITKPGLDV